MTLPSVALVCDTIDATWPAASEVRVGPWLIRAGAQGGNRVSAARAIDAMTAADVTIAEDAMRDLGQEPLFCIRPGDDAADTVLADAGYIRRDATVIYAAPIDTIASERPPAVSAFTVWPPLAVQAEIWAEGGIGPARLAIMDRAAGPKTTILGRTKDQPAATLYMAMHGDIAMLHALEVTPKLRRLGVAQNVTRAAAFWAKDQGAKTFTLLTTVSNAGATPLYQGLGMQEIGQYHYRTKPKE